MAGGFHSTKPFHHSVAFVANVTSKLPSALQYLLTSGFNTPQLPIFLGVLKEKVVADASADFADLITAKRVTF